MANATRSELRRGHLVVLSLWNLYSMLTGTWFSLLHFNHLESPLTLHFVPVIILLLIRYYILSLLLLTQHAPMAPIIHIIFIQCIRLSPCKI